MGRTDHRSRVMVLILRLFFPSKTNLEKQMSSNEFADTHGKTHPKDIREVTERPLEACPRCHFRLVIIGWLGHGLRKYFHS